LNATEDQPGVFLGVQGGVSEELGMASVGQEIAVFVAPSESRFFMAVLGFDLIIALSSVSTGVVAMFSKKRPGGHPKFGTLYSWSLLGVFLSATILSTMRWPRNRYLFLLGLISFGCATVGRRAHQRQWRSWMNTHITCMALSYIVMLTAFFADNGNNLPLGRELPHIPYGVAPGAIGFPLTLRALVIYRRMNRGSWKAPSNSRGGNAVQSFDV
jgi:hypothetical protein